MPFQKGQSGNPAGKAKGTRNRRTVQQAKAVEESGITPLEYMLDIMRNSDDDLRRFEAAKAAAPYVHARLSNVETKTLDPDTPASELPDSELQRIAQRGSNGTAEEAELPQQFAGVQSDSEH
jgi:hypothetical protein